MHDYIKREDAIKKVWCYVDDRDAIDELEDLPTANVVEVVRCKDCKYNAKGDNEREFWNNLCRLRPLVYVPVSDEDYCSFGETKDE